MPVASFDPSLTETTVVDGQVEFTNTSTVLADNTYNWDIGLPLITGSSKYQFPVSSG